MSKHRIYLKTEPAGKVTFGRLSDEESNMLHKAIKNKKMSEELLEIRSSGSFREYEGVFNNGAEGEKGNEGLIEYDEEGPIELPKNNLGKNIDGAYLVYLSLTKGSIEFDFELDGRKYNRNKFVEVSLPVKLPDFIIHKLYGHPNFNVVIDYKYEDKILNEYEGEIDDRGYDHLIAFIIVKQGKAKLVYQNYNGEETWG